MKFNLFLISALAVLLFACNKNEDATPSGKYSSGVFIVNEGPFQTGTGTVSFLNRDTKMVENDIFQTVNKRPLGNILQSLEIHNDRAYLVVNNAKKVEVVQAWDFKEVGTIQGLEMPRYFVGIDEKKGYVSQWGVGGIDGSVKVIDLQSNTVIKTIQVGRGAEKMLKVDNKVFVACNGGFANDNRVFVIDTQKDEVSATINTPENANSLALDGNSKIWVTCNGRSQWNGMASVTVSPAQLIRVNPANNQIEQSFVFERHGLNNLTMNTERNMLFYTYSGRVFSQNINSGVSTNPLIRRGFYGLNYDKAAELLYAADAGNFSSNGKIIRFNTRGIAVDSMTVGVAPNGFYFR
jgi:DNA-binding beta-propeller fold protein YncE